MKSYHKNKAFDLHNTEEYVLALFLLESHVYVATHTKYNTSTCNIVT